MARRRYRRRRPYRRRYRRRYRRYASARLPWSMKTKLWQTDEIRFTMDPASTGYVALPLNQLVLHSFALKNENTNYTLPTSMIGRKLSYKAETLCGTFNKYTVMGAKVKVRFTNTASNNAPLRLYCSIVGVGGGSNAGTGFVDTVNWLRGRPEAMLLNTVGIRHYDAQIPASSRNVVKYSRYVSTRKMLHISKPMDDEHLKLKYPTIDTATGDLLTGDVPDTDHTYGLFLKIFNPNTSAGSFNLKISVTWYVRLFDRVRNVRDVVDDYPNLVVENTPPEEVEITNENQIN